MRPNKASITSNPFKRPFSEVNPGKKQPIKREQLDSKFLITEEPQIKESNLITGGLQNKFTGLGASFGGAPAEPGGLNNIIEQSYGGQSAISKISQKDVELNYIMEAISAMDDNQRSNLVDLLQSKKLPGLDSKSSQGRIDQFIPTPTSKQTDQPAAAQNFANAIFTLGKASAPVQSMHGNGMTEVVIRILTTHGDPHLCGLTEVELFDPQGQKIRLIPTNLNVRNIGRNAQVQQARQLINDVKFTTESKHMMVANLPPPVGSRSLEVVICVSKSQRICSLKIWNYNRSLFHGTKGAKSVQVLVDGEIRW